jgi:regulator of protease activity HflC (stomatin/prohibitin superfamily)
MGISSILSFLALGGFVLFIIGIGMAVLNASQGKRAGSGVALGAIGLIAGLLFSVISQGILIVQPNQIAVVFNTLSGNLEQPRRAGTHIIIPVIQQATIYPLEQMQYTMSGREAEGALPGDDAVRARTTDGQEVRMDVTVIFGLDPDQVNLVHQRWQNRYITDFIRPTARGIVRDVVSQFTAAGIYGQDRGRMENDIQAAMETRMAEEGLLLNDLLAGGRTGPRPGGRSARCRHRPGGR